MKINELPARFDAQRHLQPLWRTEAVYDETALIVGDTGECTLAFLPSGGLTVRSYTLDRIFREGVDFSVEGKVLRRLAGGSLPYFQTEEYFRREPDSVPIGVNRAFSEIPLEGQRFLAYGERDTFTSREIAVSYEAAENDFGFLPQREKALEPLVKRLKAQGGGSVLFYGDSITVGCNASATEYGGNLPPYTPSWAELTGTYLEKTCGVPLKTVNRAVGGWRAADGIREMESRMLSAPYDLMVLAYGMNDGPTAPAVFAQEIRTLAEAFLSRNPEGYILLVSTMLPNRQSDWRLSHAAQEGLLEEVAHALPRTGLARVSSAFRALEETGKRTRDFLANNINHPNDFGVRLYAEVILTALLGEGEFLAALNG